MNELYEKNPKLNPFPNKKYRYRLPTEGEWETAACGKLDVVQFPFGYTSMIDKKGRQMANFKIDTVTNQRRYWLMLFSTLPIVTYYQNNNGCYNMIGNVSEMVSTKDIAKGGNFLLPLDSYQIKMEQHYTKPEAWLGFRCVCEIVN